MLECVRDSMNAERAPGARREATQEIAVLPRRVRPPKQALRHDQAFRRLKHETRITAKGRRKFNVMHGLPAYTAARSCADAGRAGASGAERTATQTSMPSVSSAPPKYPPDSGSA